MALEEMRSHYERYLKEYPYMVHGALVSILMIISDLIAQCVAEETPYNEINWTRTAQFGSMGLFFVGPSLNAWYTKLESSIDPEHTQMQRALEKLALDQLVFAPFFQAVFTTGLSAIQGLSPNEIVERLKNEYPQIMKTNYLFWPAAQFINFSVIPVEYQVEFAQSLAIIFNSYVAMSLGQKYKK